MILDPLALTCPLCKATFVVMTELQNHRLAQHERPIPATYGYVILRPILDTPVLDTPIRKT